MLLSKCNERLVGHAVSLTGQFDVRVVDQNKLDVRHYSPCLYCVLFDGLDHLSFENNAILFSFSLLFIYRFVLLDFSFREWKQGWGI